MGKWHRLMVYLGFRAESELEPGRPGDYYVDGDDPSGFGTVTPISMHRDTRLPSREPALPSGFAGVQGDFRKIQSVKPRTYNDARLIGEAYRKGIPVIMNLTEMSDAEAKRLVDFSAGLSFGLAGEIERVTPSVFVLSPAHIKVGGESEPPLVERSFYNQS